MRALKIACAFWCMWSVLAAAAQVPGLLHYQGRILSGSTAFEGAGLFKFSLVNGTGSQTFWRNAPDGNSDGQPDSAVSLTVTKGLYSVHLGDTSLPNMETLPTSAFDGGDVHLRVWFNDGSSGFQQLVPDQRIASVAYALVSSTVPDASITAAKFAPNALQAGSLTGILVPGQLPADVAYKSTDLLTTSNTLSARLATLQAQVDALVISTGSTLPPGATAASDSAADATLLAAGFQVFSTLTAPAWFTSAASDAPSARHAHAAIWSQNAAMLFVWGGQVGVGTYSGIGATYEPGSDHWQGFATVGAPSARRGHSIVSDGAIKALVWGGFNETGYLNTGARFDFPTRSWIGLAPLNAPVARDGHVAIWIGPSMLVWGGRNSAGPRSDGALYHSANDQWTTLALPGPPAARSGATAVWTGDRVLIWGGTGLSGAVATGSQLRFQITPTVSPIEWRPVQTVGTPSARTEHSAVWTGSRMIVWGGRNGGALFSDGAVYDPIADSWTVLPATDAPTARASHAAVWTGREMVILGGETATGSTSTGAAYNPETNRWRPLMHGGSPIARSGVASAWTGAEIILFGGQSDGTPVASLQRLSPQPAWHLYRKP